MNNTDRIRLKVLGISYSQIQSGAYALILAQTDGPYRIPVVIGAAEAQSIALRMESITPPRPMTHDLFVSFAHAFGIKLIEVFIYRFEDGIFSSELTFTDSAGRTVSIDSRTSDAIAIAMRTNAPIFTTPEILDETGFIIENQAEEGEDDDEAAAADAPIFSEEQDDDFGAQPDYDSMSLDDLRATLSRLIEQENYEEAALVNEIIKKRNPQ